MTSRPTPDWDEMAQAAAFEADDIIDLPGWLIWPQPEEGVLCNTESPPIQVAQPALVQRMLEQSNVQPVKELTTMIWVQRSYEAVQKFMDGEDDRIKRAVNYIIPST